MDMKTVPFVMAHILLLLTSWVSSNIDVSLLEEASIPAPLPPAKASPSPPVPGSLPPPEASPSPPAKNSPPSVPIQASPPPPAVFKPFPPPPVQSPPRNTEECFALCKVRCTLHSRKNVCMRACVTCCDRCKCVPPGYYGQKEKCGKCYANMTTRGGRPKCP